MKKVKKQCNVHCRTFQKEEKKKQGNERIRTKGLKKEEKNDHSRRFDIWIIRVSEKGNREKQRGRYLQK